MLARTYLTSRLPRPYTLLRGANGSSGSGHPVPRQRGETVYGVWSVTDLCAAFARDPTSRVVDRNLRPLPGGDRCAGSRQLRPSVCRVPKPGDVRLPPHEILYYFKSGGRSQSWRSGIRSPNDQPRGENRDDECGLSK